MSARVILGGAALAGAAYYVYENNAEKHLAAGGPLLQQLAQDARAQLAAAASAISDKLAEAALWTRSQYKVAVGNASDVTEARIQDAQEQLKAGKRKAQALVDEAKAALDEAQKELSKYKRLFFGWGQAKGDEAAERAQKTYDDAKGRFDGVKKDADNYVAKLAAVAELYSKTGAAKFGEAKDKLVAAINQAQDELDKAHLQWEKLATVWQRKEDELAAATLRGLAGWGETASEFARERQQEVLALSPTLAVTGWFSRLLESVKRLLDDAEASAKEAKAQLDEIKGRWYQFGRKVNEEAKKDAEARYAAAQAKADEAKQAWDQWVAESKKAGAKGVDKAQDALDLAHLEAQGWLSSVKGWFGK